MNRKQAEHDRTVLPRIQELKAEGRSLRGIAEQLQRDGVPRRDAGGSGRTSPSGASWTARSERHPRRRAHRPQAGGTAAQAQLS